MDQVNQTMENGQAATGAMRGYSSGSGIAAEELDQLALDIVRECQGALMLRFLYLDSALWRMKLVPDRRLDRFATNGVELRFGPAAVVMRYRKNPDLVIRDLLHVMLHCIFRHPFDDRPRDVRIFSATCDIIVESLAMEICDQQFPNPMDNRRRAVLETLQITCPGLVPAKLYHYIFDNLGDEDLRALNLLFGRDSHTLWVCNRKYDESFTRPPMSVDDTTPDGRKLKRLSSLAGEEEETDLGSSFGVNTNDEGEAGQGSDDQGSKRDDEDAPDELPEGSENENGAAGVVDEPDDEELEKAQKTWEDVAKQIEVDLETHSKTWGRDAANFSQTLSVANREHYDYDAFLRKFAVLGEDIRLNDDEFDYIYYTFGLDTYGDMPLVEPLEYKEDSCTRDFCIAIDTSGSCSGELVRAFVQRTYDILRSTESFGDKVNIHIIQCDARVQKDTKITNLLDLSDYLKEDITVFGFGGTDFRPVFEYVDRLVEKGEFDDLRGLIYFTDGLGTYPEHRPAYDAAFVFMNDELANVKIPPWAMKVILDEDSFREL